MNRAGNAARMLIGCCALVSAGHAAADHRRVVVLDGEYERVEHAHRHHHRERPVVVVREVIREPVVVRERVYVREAGPRYYYDYGPDRYAEPRRPSRGASGGDVLLGQTLGAVTGGVVGSAIGQGRGRTAAMVVGGATGALVGGKWVDPCQPDLNAGHVLGTIAGGALGYRLASGGGRNPAAAAGAALGAVVGGNLGGHSACR